MIFRRVELNFGERVADVRVEAGAVTAIEPTLEPQPEEEVIEGDGAMLLPGLHDHHIHLNALAASLASVKVGPSDLDPADHASLSEALKTAPHDENGWVRAVGYHESVAGELDRKVLDRLCPDSPVRIQHRTGAMWFLNTKALEQLTDSGAMGDATFPGGVERDASGSLTGRLFRVDSWLASRLASREFPNLRDVGSLLLSYGVTGCSDATPTNAATEWAAFEQAQAQGALPQQLYVMGSVDLTAKPGAVSPAAQRLRAWNVKVILDDTALPSLDELATKIATAHEAGRGVAIHCVTHLQLLFALAAWEQAGVGPFDRIEHGSICPPDATAQIASLGLAVVTQPAFIAERGDDYLRDVEPNDQPWLYRCAGLDNAGVPVAAGTDAPYATADPWTAMRAAVDRRTRSGRPIGSAECVTPRRAIELFLSPPEAPGGTPRQVEVGTTADLCLLGAPWRTVGETLEPGTIRSFFHHLT